MTEQQQIESQHLESRDISPQPTVQGRTSLPLARTKRIIQSDEDIVQCSNNATFAISVATELFIQYLTQQGHNVVKSEKKPRRNLQYRDIATAVSRIDNLDFLSDVVPRTMTYKQFKEKQQRPKDTAGNHKSAATNATTMTTIQTSADPTAKGRHLHTDDNSERSSGRHHQANKATPSLGQRTLFDLPRSFSRQPPVQPSEPPQPPQSHEADVSIHSLINESEAMETDGVGREESNGVPMEEE